MKLTLEEKKSSSISYQFTPTLAPPAAAAAAASRPSPDESTLCSFLHGDLLLLTSSVSAVADDESSSEAARARLESLSQVAGVLGTQWGDEGKGKIVYILAQHLDVVARCQELAMTVNMDLAPFRLDIDELLADYAKENFTTFSDFKRIWTTKKFSCIYEGRPKTNSGVFMQSLFLHCIGHMTSQSSLSQRLAGLYCLYCLYECQPYKPHFKIYLSLEESKKLKDFAAEAKQSGVGLVPALVKRMLDKGMFLFGFINFLSDHGAKEVDELNVFQNKRVKFACDKLFANTQIESSICTDLAEEFELDTIKKLSMDYAKAKELAFAEASQIVDVEDAKHMLQNDKLLGDRVDDIVKEWDAQKEEFYQKTVISRNNELAVVDNDRSGEFHDESGEFHDEDDGFNELEQLLLLE